MPRYARLHGRTGSGALAANDFELVMLLSSPYFDERLQIEKKPIPDVNMKSWRVVDCQNKLEATLPLL